jgi:nuclear RNA export factor
VAAFCVQFFNAFDQDRASLMDVYATKSSFSLCASPYIPSRAKAAGLTRNSSQMPAQQVPSWNEYISISRNNAKLKGPSRSYPPPIQGFDSRISSIHISNPHINHT